MDVISLVSLIQSKKNGGDGGSFPVNEFFARTATELTLTGATKLGQGSLYQCTTLEKLYLPDVTEISSGAISGCTNLSNIVMGENLVTIGGTATSAIAGSINLKSLTIPSSVKTLAWNGLTGATGLETVTFLGKPELIGSVFNSTALPTSVKTINVPWAEGEVSGAPWGATSAQINYNYKGD